MSNNARTQAPFATEKYLFEQKQQQQHQSTMNITYRWMVPHVYSVKALWLITANFKKKYEHNMNDELKTYLTTMNSSSLFDGKHRWRHKAGNFCKAGS